jgi:hypothetical protein
VQRLLSGERNSIQSGQLIFQIWIIVSSVEPADHREQPETAVCGRHIVHEIFLVRTVKHAQIVSLAVDVHGGYYCCCFDDRVITDWKFVEIDFAVSRAGPKELLYVLFGCL